VSAREQAILGTVTHPSQGGLPEKQDQPYGSEHEGTGEPASDTSVWGEAAGWPALSETSGKGADTLQAARRRTRQRRTQR
jgi:hypothetical protein